MDEKCMLSGLSWLQITQLRWWWWDSSGEQGNLLQTIVQISLLEPLSREAGIRNGGRNGGRNLGDVAKKNSTAQSQERGLRGLWMWLAWALRCGSFVSVQQFRRAELFQSVDVWTGFRNDLSNSLLLGSRQKISLNPHVGGWEDYG